MAWLVIDTYGVEYVFNEEPIRNFKTWSPRYPYTPDCVRLPKGSILKLIGKELSWEDEPYRFE